jgi:hypothetical protein
MTKQIEENSEVRKNSYCCSPNIPFSIGRMFSPQVFSCSNNGNTDQPASVNEYSE